MRMFSKMKMVVFHFAQENRSMTTSLKLKIDTLWGLLSKGYDGHQMAVKVLIEDIDAHIQQNFGQIPPWERYELDAARAHADGMLLKAALYAAGKALVVSDFSDDEYWGGYQYTHKGIKRVLRHKT